MRRYGAKITYTVDEIISTLQHSSLPTVITEGDDDIIVFRRLEDTFSELGLSIMSVGGRDTVLKLFQRRYELTETHKVAFIADRDIWVISGIPTEYRSDVLLFTSGYSIENDIFLDGNLENLMSKDERLAFRKEIELFVRWYALAIFRLLGGKDQVLEIHPNILLDGKAKTAEMMHLKDGEVYPEELYKKIISSYGTYLRGKSLLAVLIRQLSYKGRRPRHNEKSLLEVVAVTGGPLLQRFQDEIARIFETPEKASDKLV